MRRARRLWRERDEGVPLVVNANTPATALAPVSEARADATRAGWVPLEPGQPVPLTWER